MSTRSFSARTSALLLVTLTALGCQRDNPAGPVAVASVQVAMSSPTVFVGRTATATAVLTDVKGGIATGRTVAWSSSNSSMATVSAAGVVAAIAPGTVSITATSEGKTGTAQLTIVPVPVASVRVQLTNGVLQVGQTTSATAVALDSANAPLSARTISWTSENPAIATVSSAGVVTAAAPGRTTIRATSEGQNGSASITVLPSTTARFDTVAFSADVTAAARARVVSIVSTFDSIAVQAGRVVTDQQAPVLALAANGGVLYVAKSGTVNSVLGPKSTALNLLAILFPAKLRPALNDTQMADWFQRHPRFPALVAALTQGGEAGTAIDENTVAMTIASEIVIAFARELQPKSAPVRSGLQSSADHPFSGIMGSVAFPQPGTTPRGVDAGDAENSTIRLLNSTYYGFGVQVLNAATQEIVTPITHLPRRTFDPFGFEFGAPLTVDVNAVADGEALIRLGQHPDAAIDRCNTVFATVTSLIVRFVFGDQAKPVADAVATQTGGIIACDAKLDLRGYLLALWNGLLGDGQRLERYAGAIWKAVLSQLENPGSGLFLVMRLSFALIKVLDFASFLLQVAGFIPFATDWASYNGLPYSMAVCKANRSISPCVRSISVTPASLFIEQGNTAGVTAVARDSANRALPYTLSWQSTVPSIAAVNTPGIVTAQSTALAGQSASIDISWGTARARVPVTITPRYSGTYSLTAFNGSRLPYTVVTSDTSTFVLQSGALVLNRGSYYISLSGEMRYRSKKVTGSCMDLAGMYTPGASTVRLENTAFPYRCQAGDWFFNSVSPSLGWNGSMLTGSVSTDVVSGTVQFERN